MMGLVMDTMSSGNHSQLLYDNNSNWINIFILNFSPSNAVIKI